MVHNYWINGVVPVISTMYGVVTGVFAINIMAVFRRNG